MCAWWVCCIYRPYRTRLQWFPHYEYLQGMQMFNALCGSAADSEVDVLSVVVQLFDTHDAFEGLPRNSVSQFTHNYQHFLFLLMLFFYCLQHSPVLYCLQHSLRQTQVSAATPNTAIDSTAGAATPDSWFCCFNFNTKSFWRSDCH